MQTKLPTGGKVEYTYGAGLRNPAGKPGIYGSGQVLSDDTAQYGAALTNFHRPFIYRRLTERREYSKTDATTPIRTTEYSQPESVTGVLPAGADQSSIVTSVSIASDNYIEVTEKEGSAVLRRSRHHYFTQHPNTTLDYGGAARQLGLTYPPGTGTMAGYPAPFQSPKEHRTETLDGATVAHEKSAAWAVTANQAAYECTTKETLYQTGLNAAGTLPQLYGLQKGLVVVRDLFLNETDRYEFAYGTVTSQASPAPLTCSSSDGYYRHTHTDYLATYQNADGPFLVNPPTKETVKDSAGAEVAVTEWGYDQHTPVAGVQTETFSSLTDRGLVEGGPGDVNATLPAGTQARANLTSVVRVRKVKAPWVPTEERITTYLHYDTAGNVVKFIDARGNPTSITYDAANFYTFRKSVTNALSHAVTATYDLNLGLPNSVTDANSVLTQLSYTDPLDRLTAVSRAGATTSFAYPFDAASSTTRIVTKKLYSGTSNQVVERLVDGLGRQMEGRAARAGSDCTTITDCLVTKQKLDGLGRSIEAYNPVAGATPTACSGTSPCVRTVYDALGRVHDVTHQDGTVSKSRYNFLTSTNTGATTSLATTGEDPAGVKRVVLTDGFGRITSAKDLNGATEFVTAYTYDALNNLTGVTQSDTSPVTSQSRTFVYDSIARLLESSQPENGAIKYTYDRNGNVTKKDDGRGESLTAEYDALNRIKKRSYPSRAAQTPDVHFEYDLDLKPDGETAANFAKGQLARVRVGTSDATTNQYTYQLFDAHGRVLRAEQRVDTTPYTMRQEFDLAGQLKAIEYPSSPVRRVNYWYNQLGQVTAVTDGAGKAYASGLEYAPYGAMTKMVLGNDLIERMTPNSRLQPEKIELGSSTVTDEVGAFTFGYTGATCVAGQTWANNGNVVSQTIKAGAATFTQTYGYDGLNRLKCVKEGTQWQQVYEFDPYGNRWLTTNSLPAVSALTATVKGDFNPANNRLRTTPTGERYDQVGNLERLSGGTGAASVSHDLVYDGESRVVTANNVGSITTYVYDGLGRRVKAGNRVFVYLPDGRLAMEVGVTGTEPGTVYVTADHLGSTRVVTRQNQSVASRFDYAPYGEELGAGTGGRTEGQGYGVLSAAFGVSGKEPKQRFTSKERDLETGLDYFGARYFSGELGGFTSPDPLLGSANPLNSQSWNRYVYTLNSPLRYTDPFGLYEWDATLGGSATDDELRKHLSKKAANKIIDRRGDIRKAIAKGAGSKDADVSGAYQVYGAEGDPNGVMIANQRPTSAGVGSAGQQLEYVGGSFRSKATVAVDPNQSGNDLFITLGHEGSHVRDGQAYAEAAGRLSDVPALGPFNLSVLQTEMNAYSTSVNAARMLGLPNLNYAAGGQTYRFWQGGTAAVDR